MFERPAKEGELVQDFFELRAAEGEEVWKRRDAVQSENGPGPTRNPIPPDLVGLALSGGGSRAASIGLGVLQRFYALGLLKFTDYLSTVSGGGYIGAAYSTSAALAKKRPDEKRFPLDSDPTVAEANNGTADRRSGAGQPASIIRLIYNGKYLFRPWEAANKFLIGAFLNNLLLFSGLVVICASLVLFWRMFDRRAVRSFLALLSLDSDLYVAYFPFVFLASCWLLAWLISYWKYQAEAPGRWAQRWLYGALSALLIGTVLVLVNGYSTVGVFHVFNGGQSTAQPDDTAKWLLGLVSIGLLPLFKPDFIQRGLQPRNLFDKLRFYVASAAFLVGVPLVVIGVLGQQNLAGTGTDFHNIRAGDIASWPAFCALVDPHIGGYLDVDEPRNPDKGIGSLTAPELEKLKNLRDLSQVGPLGHENLANLLALGHTQLTFMADRLADDLRMRDRLQARLDAHYSGFWRRLVLIAGWFTIDDNPAAAWWKLDRKLADNEAKFCDLFNDTVLPHAGLAASLFGSHTPLATLMADVDSGEQERVAVPNVTRVISWLKLRNLELNDRLKGLVADAGLSSQTDWYAKDRKEVNREVLLATHPECFYDPNKIYRWNVVVADQSYRWFVLFGSAAIFALTVFSVDLNTTSLHRFYRNRLAYAYLPGREGGRPNLNLGALNTAEYGAPYQLFNASINLTRSRFLDQVDEESSEIHAERRPSDNFLLSHLFCGCQETGWARTRSYEWFLNDNISVADAMALSGAAIDTMQLDSLPVTLLGLALNLNIGQWLPNPKYAKPAFKARAWRLLADIKRPVAESGYCSVSDGGFTDNLGIVALLKRRCRLIIALDAGCDPKHQLADLANVIRTARIHEGIEIRQLGGSTASELNTQPLVLDSRGFCPRHHLVAEIRYPDTDRTGEPATGLLIYLKASLTGDEPVDLLEQRVRDPSFPHHDTTDQFHSARDIECYRQLGFHIADQVAWAFRGLFPHEANLWGQSKLDIERVEELAKEDAAAAVNPSRITVVAGRGIIQPEPAPTA